MTNPPIQDSQASIAGEPAHDRNNKNYPTIGQRNKESIFQDTENQSVTNKKRTKKLFVAAQIICIIAALVMSGYAVFLNDSFDLQNNSSKSGTEILVRTEGRTADHICSVISKWENLV